MATVTYSVPGISCGHCKAAIEAEVGAVAGIDSVDVNVADKTVTVTAENVEALDDTVIAAIDEAGYEVASA
jgi:hypothetical protein